MVWVRRAATLILACLVTQHLMYRVSVTTASLVLSLVLFLGCTYAAVGYARLARRSAGRMRAAWACVCVSTGCWAGPNAWFVADRMFSLRTDPGPGVAEYVNAVTLPATALAMVLMTPSGATAAMRLRRFVDTTVISVASFFVLWQVILSDLARAAAPEVTMFALGVTAFEVVVGAFALTLLARSVSHGVNAFTLQAVACFAGTVMIVIYVDNLVQTRVWFANGFGGLYVGMTVLFVVASRSSVPPVSSVEAEKMSSVAASLPYIPVALAFAVGGVAIWRHDLNDTGLWALYAMSALVLLRQFLTVRMNIALLRSLAEQRTRLAYQAFHDSLTGIANRAKFYDVAVGALREPGSNVALILIDLDGFKTVNDTLGHAAGDELLKVVAGRLTSAVRAEDLVARLGGDEFAVMIRDVEPPGDAAVLAHRVEAALTGPATLAGTTVNIRGSAGVAISRGAQHLEELLHEADVLLYRAKAAGKALAAVGDDPECVATSRAHGDRSVRPRLT
ncbi:hypothetical protein Val02_92430 [Virgisporangium aliadipatigenens]|uniref:GGDEF domain-containing protein n=1 Tax=Virgisporangium aliadipatigenens TaxID=741659 RepID=A0A8J3YXH5_9ACTN|nr:GGDEF domain-containing protein [Virgisporangium aliadipatigenens]GIJ52357.1 hypothetical protein Val02_92430 [Virgisporangium aliadipatigenens]